MNKQKKKKMFIERDDAVRVLEIYPKTKIVYDYIKEHPNTDARMIADALGEKQVYVHVNRLEECMLVDVQVQREKHYYVKHYTVNKRTAEKTHYVPLQQGTKPVPLKNVKTMMNSMKDESYNELFKKFLFDDLEEDTTRPDFLLNIGGVDCFASNSIVAVAGKPGVGKSTTMAIIAGVLIGGQNFGIIQCKRKIKRILWIDTEKDAFSCKQRMKTLRSVAKLDTNKSLNAQGVDFLLTKSMNNRDRFEFLSKISEVNSQKHIYDAIFIDGLFDLTEDPGNIARVSPVMELLKNLSSEATVFAMLHTNKQAEDNNMREVIGTELQRICTNRITITCDKNGLHRITHDKSNDTMLAQEISFIYNEEGAVQPAINGRKSKKDNDEKLSKTTTNIKEDFESILRGGLILPYSELVSKVMKFSKVGKDMAKKRIAKGYAKGHGYLDRDDNGKYWLKDKVV